MIVRSGSNFSKNSPFSESAKTNAVPAEKLGACTKNGHNFLNFDQNASRMDFSESTLKGLSKKFVFEAFC